MNNMVKLDLTQLLTLDNMFDIAGEKFFERGQNYCATGVVEDIVESRGAIKATVAGTHNYKVKIQVRYDELDYNCNCPIGQKGLFCKHLVATGLAWLQEQQQESSGKGKAPKSKKKTKKSDIFTNLYGYLNTLGDKQLIDIIIEQAENDAAFRNTLSTKALANLPTSDTDLI